MMDENYFETGAEADQKSVELNKSQHANARNLEEQAKQRIEWNDELQRTEEEINTLRQVLHSKLRLQSDLKRRLGITPMEEMKEDLRNGIDFIRGSESFQRTSSVLKTAKEKTSTTIYNKWDFLKNTSAFKSLETHVSSAYTVVKKKIIPSSSSSAEASTANDSAIGAEADAVTDATGMISEGDLVGDGATAYSDAALRPLSATSSSPPPGVTEQQTTLPGKEMAKVGLGGPAVTATVK